MTNKEYLLNEIQSIIVMLNSDELPETHEYLSELLAQDEYTDYNLYSIATEIRCCDKHEVFPDYLIAFIIELYEEEIAAGNADAMNDLGALYYDSRSGNVHSFEKAMYYYQMAAEQGSIISNENLGYCWYYGRNGEKDYEKAFQYFAYGALYGSLASIYKIGDMYLNGYYVPQSDKRACDMYMRCLSLMNDDTPPIEAGPVYLRLGRVLLNGIGTDKRPKSALVCFQKAEACLFEVLKNGDYIYKNDWMEAINSQEKARKELLSEITEKGMVFDLL